MLSPVAIATWISFCLPGVAPAIPTAMVIAGSGGEPHVIVDAGGQATPSPTFAAALADLRSRKADGELYLGLAGVPRSAAIAAGYAPEEALDICGSLEIGYQLYQAAYQHAQKIEKTPMKTIGVAFSWYRARQTGLDLPYTRKATEFLTAPKLVPPAGAADPLRWQVAAEWSAGLGQRLALRASAMHQRALLTSRPPANTTAVKPGIPAGS